MWRDDLPTVDDTLALLHHPRRGREAGQGIIQHLRRVLLVVAHVVLEVRGDAELLQLRALQPRLLRMSEDHIIHFLQAIEGRDRRTREHIVRSEQVDLQMPLVLERRECRSLYHPSRVVLTQLFLEEVVVLTWQRLAEAPLVVVVQLVELARQELRIVRVHGQRLLTDAVLLHTQLLGRLVDGEVVRRRDEVVRPRLTFAEGILEAPIAGRQEHDDEGQESEGQEHTERLPLDDLFDGE